MNKPSPESPPPTAAPPIAILGVPFDNVTTAETIELIEQMVTSRRPHYLATANVDFLVQALHDVELRRILLDAHLVLCDGTPLVWASRLLGNPLPERVAGSDLVPLIIQIAAQKKHRIFFLGGTPEATRLAVSNLENQFPDLIIAGHYSPPFSMLLEMDHDEIKRRIHEAKPDLLFVSFGCPKQEKWIAMHYRALGVPVAVGVGATIDFLAGTARRAPKIMQRTGTEWIFRLIQEPRRLFRRYVSDLWWFGRAIVRQWWEMQLALRRSPAAADLAPAKGTEISKRLKLPERLDIKTVRNNGIVCEQALASCRNCLLDLSGVKFIDSTGMGLLIRLQRRARVTDRKVILLSPSTAAQSALKIMRLQDFFTVARDDAAAQKLMDAQPMESPVLIRPGYYTSKPSLFWRGEVTAANAEQVWESTHRYIASRVNASNPLLIDLTALQFIDSTGVGIMLRAKKNALQQGLKLVFTGIQPNVRNVLRLAKLESFLLGDTP